MQLLVFDAQLKHINFCKLYTLDNGRTSLSNLISQRIRLFILDVVDHFLAQLKISSSVNYMTLDNGRKSFELINQRILLNKIEAENFFRAQLKISSYVNYILLNIISTCVSIDHREISTMKTEQTDNLISKIKKYSEHDGESCRVYSAMILLLKDFYIRRTNNESK